MSKRQELLEAKERELRDAVEQAASDEAISALVAEMAAELGADEVARFFEEWVDESATVATPRPVLTRMQSQVAGAAERAARALAKEAGWRLARVAHRLHREWLGDGEAESRLAVLSLVLCPPEADALKATLDAVGDAEGAIHLLSRALKSKDIKDDTMSNVAHRRALARVCEVAGDADRAFFETLKLVRKLPEEPLYVDEAFRLALATAHQPELVPVFEDLLENDALPDRQRAAICNKIAHLKERFLDDLPGARDAYILSLRFNPKAKGARRHIERLARALGLPEDEDFPEPPDSDAASVTRVGGSSLLSESAEDDYDPDADLPATDEFKRRPRPREKRMALISVLTSDEGSGEDVFANLPDAPHTDAEASSLEHISLSGGAPSIDNSADVFADGAKLEDFDDEPTETARNEGPSKDLLRRALPSALQETAVVESPAPELLAKARPSTESEPVTDLEIRISDENLAISEESAPVPPPLPFDAASDEGPPSAPTTQADEPSIEVPSADASEAEPEQAPPNEPEPELEPESEAEPAQELGATSFEASVPDEDLAPPDDEPEVTAPHAELPPDFDQEDDAPVALAASKTDVTAEGPAYRSSDAWPSASGEDVFASASSYPDGLAVVHEAPSGEESAVPDNFDTGAAEPPKPSVPEPLEDIRWQIDTVIDSGDPDAMRSLASELDGTGVEPFRLRLLGRALCLHVEQGTPIPSDLVSRFASNVSAAPEVALDFARELAGFVRDDRGGDDGHAAEVDGALAAVARSVADIDAVAEVLHDRALATAPSGTVFCALDRAFVAAGAMDRRLALREAAAAHAEDRQRRVAIRREHISLLQESARAEETLPLYEVLALDDAPDDRAIRAEATAAFDSFGSLEEKLAFFGALSKDRESDVEAAPLWRRLVALRSEAQQGEGVEEAARVLRALQPDSTVALDALLKRTEHDPGRRDERSELLRERLALARLADDLLNARRLVRALTDLCLESGQVPEAIGHLKDHVDADPRDEDAVERLVTLLDESDRGAEATARLLAQVEHIQGERNQAALLLRIAQRTVDDSPEAASEHLDRALALDPNSAAALSLRADVAILLGDRKKAIADLEQLLVHTDDQRGRARLQLRLGQLLEEKGEDPTRVMKRYQAACDTDPELREAWEALLALCDREGDAAQKAQAIKGLLAFPLDDDRRVELLLAYADAVRDSSGPGPRVVEALVRVLEAAPESEAALERLVRTLVELHGPPSADVDEVLARPPVALLTAFAKTLEPLFAKGSSANAPFNVRRAYARAIAVRGDRLQAAMLFSALFQESREDRATLLWYADVLQPDVAEDAPRRREVLETLLSRFESTLEEEDRIAWWGELGALRFSEEEDEAARAAFTRAVNLARSTGLVRALSDRALRAAVALFERDIDVEPRIAAETLRIRALRAGGQRGAEELERAVRIGRTYLSDTRFVRQLLEEALSLDPAAHWARKALIELDIGEGNAEAAIERTRKLIDQELDSRREAAHHVVLAELLRQAQGDTQGAAEHLKRAIQLNPNDREALDAAEDLFAAEKDAEGLSDLYTAQLRQLARTEVKGRINLLERLAQVKRYDLRDIAGAIEALEAMIALDPELMKAREDSARLYTELGDWKSATSMWRGVLEREPLHREAWRGLLSLYRKSGQPDETFVVASTVSAVELGDENLGRAVRRARPPFPKWPKVSKNADATRRKIAHDLERSPVRSVFELVGQRVHGALTEPLESFGVSRRDVVPEKRLPPSMVLALRTVSDLVGLHDLPVVVGSDREAVKTSGFALLPARTPVLLASHDVLKGGMTPERAFALGRAANGLTPHGLLAAALGARQLKALLESLVGRFLPGTPLEADAREMGTIAERSSSALFRGLSPDEGEKLQAALITLLRDYVHVRGQLVINDWLAGVAYTSDRIGFLLSGELTPAIKQLKAAAAQDKARSARRAIKELVLFSVSERYMQLRRELGLTLSDDAAAPLLEIE